MPPAPAVLIARIDCEMATGYWLYLTMMLAGAALNAGAAFWFRRAERIGAAAAAPPKAGGWSGLRDGRPRAWMTAAATASVACLGLALWAVFDEPLGLPEALKRALNAAAAPWAILFSAAVVFALAAWFREVWVRPGPAWLLGNAIWLVVGLSWADPHFAAVAGEPDHLPVLGMVGAVLFFLWVGTAQAVENDRRMRRRGPADSAIPPADRPSSAGSAKGGGQTRGDAEPCPAGESLSSEEPAPVEKLFARKVLTWPDLVYIELIAACWAMAVLIAWSLLAPAPLEAPADPAQTPNPAKAPWYFVGLQELLVYGDAWWAGVAVPLLIIVGLAAIPYLDRSPTGSGYYSIASRRFAWVVFVGGFLLLWILPMVIGVFVRGPNWSAFGPYEPRDARRLTAERRATLSQWLGRAETQPAAGSSAGAPAAAPALATAPAGPIEHRPGRLPLVREWPGLTILGGYLFVLPWLLGWGPLRWARCRLGPVRYWVFSLLLLLMLLVPLKMILHWTLGLASIVHLPEYGLSF